MESVKYVGLDVHQATISIAVISAQGRLLMTFVVRTEAAAILQTGPASTKLIRSAIRLCSDSL